MVASQTTHRGTLPGASIGASIHVAACEAVGLQHDRPGVRLAYFAFVGEAAGDDPPDVEFEVIEQKPEWW